MANCACKSAIQPRLKPSASQRYIDAAQPADSLSAGENVNMAEKRVYLVDASIYVYRAWFALPVSITDRDGHPANAVYGFLDFAWRLLDTCRSARVAFVFDGSLRESFRSRIYPAYKANRPPAPLELKRQFTVCREIVRALGYPVLASYSHEADDLIGALAVRARAHGYSCTIVSGDKDLTQLISDGDWWWDFARGVRLDAHGVERRFGVCPRQIADLLAIAGDKIDNIPGIAGIGLATAAKLLRRFDTLENLLDNTANIGAMRMRGAARVQQLVEAHRDTSRLAQRLTRIDCAAELPEALAVERGPVDTAQLNAIFDKLAYRARTRWNSAADEGPVAPILAP